MTRLRAENLQLTTFKAKNTKQHDGDFLFVLAEATTGLKQARNGLRDYPVVHLLGGDNFERRLGILLFGVIGAPNPFAAGLENFHVAPEKVHDARLVVVHGELKASLAGLPLASVLGQKEAFDPDVDVAVVRTNRQGVFHFQCLSSVEGEHIVVDVILVDGQFLSRKGPGHFKGFGQEAGHIFCRISKENQVSGL